MLIKFQTKAYAPITMFGDVGVALIKLMGHSGTVPGALLAEDVPEALARLQRAVTEHAGERLDHAPDGARKLEESEHVSLAHRALPLIELLKAAEADGENVMWETP